MKSFTRVLTLTAGCILALAAYIFYPPEPRVVQFPEGKRFAFSIVDDTDMATYERVKPLYDLLDRYGIHTTKTVWVWKTNEPSHEPNHGDSLQDPAYRAYMQEIQARGFEIALHGVRGGSSTREDIVAGLELFKEVLGQYPAIHVNHSLNQDNVYWGEHRWTSTPFRWLYAAIAKHHFFGEDSGSAYFWGDLVQRHIRYVNQFTYGEINLLAVNPAMPYRLEDKPYVTYWFPTADGDNLDRFEDLLRKDNLDRLEREGGVCLVYTHMGAGSFNVGDKANPRFESRLKDLASRNGWFAPASEILDYLRAQPGWTGRLSVRETVRLEVLFFINSLLRSVMPAPAPEH
jgi:hypothetical protein